MAILGGAGNPVGGSFTGPAEAIEIIGNHCYAYSGNVQNTGTSAPDTTMLKFTTGNYYSVVAFNFSVDKEAAAVYDIVMKLNGSIIYDSEFDGSPIHGIWLYPVHVILPAYTEFEFLFGCDSAATAQAIMTGRIYRTRD